MPLDKNQTRYDLKKLKPYTDYKISVHAYVNGKVQRNGSAETSIFKTGAAGMLYALVLLCMSGKEQSMNFVAHTTSICMLHLGNMLTWHIC